TAAGAGASLAVRRLVRGDGRAGAEVAREVAGLALTGAGEIATETVGAMAALALPVAAAGGAGWTGRRAGRRLTVRQRSQAVGVVLAGGEARGPGGVAGEGLAAGARRGQGARPPAVAERGGCQGVSTAALRAAGGGVPGERAGGPRPGAAGPGAGAAAAASRARAVRRARGDGGAVAGRDVAGLAAPRAGAVAADTVDAEARGAGAGGGAPGAEGLARERIDARVGDGAPARSAAVATAATAASLTAGRLAASGAASACRPPAAGSAASTGASTGATVTGDGPAAARGRGARRVGVGAVGRMPAVQIPAAGEALRTDAAGGTAERPVTDFGRIAAGRGQQVGRQQDAEDARETRAHRAASAAGWPPPPCRAHR